MRKKFEENLTAFLWVGLVGVGIIVWILGGFEPSEAQKAAHFIENFDTQDSVTK